MNTENQTTENVNENVTKTDEELAAEMSLLQNRLNEMEERNTRLMGYWENEKLKVSILTALVKAGVKPFEYMCAVDFVEKIIAKI